MSVLVNGKEHKVRGGALYLRNKGITSLKEIEGLHNLYTLRVLDLSGNKISNMDDFGDLFCLEDLNLENNFISNIEGLENSTKIIWLNLSDNKISKIEGLGTLENLRGLWLGHNNVTRIEGLDSLSHLEELHLDDNNIKQISGLEPLTGLKRLSLENNSIIKVEGLQTLSNIQEIKLGGNPLFGWDLSQGRQATSYVNYCRHQIELEEANNRKKEQEIRLQKEMEEESEIDKLKKLMQASRRMKISQIGQYLGIEGQELLDHLVNWASDFGFKIDGDIVDFIDSQKEDFIAELERAFATWREEDKTDKV